MARAVLPAATPHELWMLAGRTDQSEPAAHIGILEEKDFDGFSNVLDDEEDTDSGSDMEA